MTPSDTTFDRPKIDNPTAEPGKVSLEMLESGVAVIRLGAPEERVVTLTSVRMASLRDVVTKLKEKPAKGVVFLGSGPDMFTAGADINVIREVKDPAVGEALAREGQSLFDLIAALPCPTVAAISGPCVGGGCELVLACSHRLISDQKSSTIGLPEVKLGILPGFGGTQRLPRLIGLPKALDIILGGKTLKPKQALACGLVDEVVAVSKLRDRAESVALSPEKTKKKGVKLLDKILTFTSFGRRIVRKNATQGIKKETKGFYPAPPAALHAAINGLEVGMVEGLNFEAKELGRLIVTPESKSLVKIFFLTEASKSIGKSAKKAVDHLHAVVIGAGAMGAGIASVLAKNECSVILKDTTEEAIGRGVKHIREYVGKLKYLSEAERSFILNRVEATTRESPNTGNANFAIEAIFEEISVKKKVLSEISKIMPSDALIATNTSSLSVTEIATAIENPERVVGMHFFNPVEKMPLVEIIRGAKTADKSVVVVAALTTKLGKFPIVVKDVPGFLVNRILSPYMTEAAYLLDDGYKIEDIDKAATDFGMPMGPIRLLDEVGLDVAAHVSDTMVAGYGDRMKGPGHAAALVALGRKGKKSGKGFYDFNGKESVPHPQIRSLLKLSKPEKTTTDLKIITDRLIMRLVNEAVLCLDEGVAGAPGPDAANQVDLGTVMGMGFPPFRGGLLHYADHLGPETVRQTLSALEKEFGTRFTPSPGIVSRARGKRKFCERATP